MNTRDQSTTVVRLVAAAVVILLVGCSASITPVRTGDRSRTISQSQTEPDPSAATPTPTAPPSEGPISEPTGVPTSLPTSKPTATPSESVDFSSIGSKEPTINGKIYSVHSAFKEHSIQRSQNGGIYRFEVREGEAREGKDEGKERSELSGGDYKFPIHTDIWLAYSMKVEPGEALTGTANVLGQFHAGEGSPNLSFRMPYDNTLQVELRVGSADKYTQVIPYVKKDFKRGEWYDIVIHARFSPDPKAVLQVWIDGQAVVDRSDFVMGYEESDSNYWKFGIYRSTSTHQTEAVQYANMELGTENLSERIANPKPIVP